jgi:hypothetical protein
MDDGDPIGFETLRRLCALALREEKLPGTRARDIASMAQVMPLAERHRVVPLLAAGLSADGRKPFLRRGLALAQQTARREQELGLISACLSAATVDFLVVKGPALARQAYPVPDARTYDDLDLWVRSRDLGTAVRKLEEAGYCSFRPLNAPASACARRAGIEVALMHPEHKRLVEVSHGWPALAPTRRGAREILEAAVTMNIGGAPVHAPAPAHAVLMACVHGAHHRWDRFVWVADVAGLWLRLPPGEREEVCATARRWRMETMLGLGLRLAADFLEIALEGRATVLAGLPRVTVLASRVGLEAMAGDAPRVPMIARLRFERDAQDSALRRLRIMAGWAFSPTLGDIEALPLPAALYPLYALIRPLRLLWPPRLRDWRKLADHD